MRARPPQTSVSACVAAASECQEGWKRRETEERKAARPMVLKQNAAVRVEGGKTHLPTVCGKRITQGLSFAQDGHSSFFPVWIPLPSFSVGGGVRLQQRLPAPVQARERCPPLHLVSVQRPPDSGPVVHKFPLTVGGPPVVRRGRRRATPGEFISVRDEQVFHAVHAGVSHVLARREKVAAP